MRPSTGSEATPASPHRGTPAAASHVYYRFGNCELRPGARQLIVEGQPAVVGARAFDLLVALVKRGGRLVTKDELFDLVWPGLVVEENNLQVQVSTLRKLLGQGVIATVPGHGYRFDAELREVDAPRFVAVQASRSELPAQLTTFVGREETIGSLREMLSRHRCITLTGVGGIGKTRLASELAATVADSYADGAWFVDLAAVSEERLVVGALAATLHVTGDADRPTIDAVHDFVRDRAMLVVLDNCEHLLSACALLVKELLQAGTRLTIVATSREALHVAGEHAFAVPALSVPVTAIDVPSCLASPAVRLFCDRAAAVNPAFALTSRNMAAVARICRELDGIPLAIELAAARTRALPVDAIASHLADRFRLLKSGDVTVLPRQQTLRATIDWSHDLLAPAERALFQRLAVFAGGFALDAAVAVGESDDVAPQDAPELLARLVDKSLVVFEVYRDRYGMLETVRQYALERLAASGEESRARDHHLAYYVTLGEWARREHDSPRQMACVARLDDERENLLLAFEHSGRKPGGGADALSMVFDYFMWFTARSIELWHGVTLDVLGRPDTQEESVGRCRALFTAGFLAYLLGRIEEALGLSEESVRIARACGDPLALAEALYDLGLCEIALSRPDQARAHLLEGRELSRDGPDPMLAASLSCGLGELYSQLGELHLAERAYLDALSESPGNPTGNMINLLNLTRNAVALGKDAKAIGYLRQAIAIADPQISVGVATHLVHVAAGVAAMRRDWVRALELHGATRAYEERLGLSALMVDGPFHERQIAPARDALGTTGADAALARGRAMDFDAAIDAAVAWIEGLPQ